eukprot:GFUD01032703.1.p1 GENE.GFUD01032703.1~~GFUD01032703.1.p1  ORF type:complete len:880 (+),score=301.05 GFUD01032703.1:157-2796(+)
MKNSITSTTQDPSLPQLLGVTCSPPDQPMTSSPTVVVFPPEVQAAIEAVLPSNDPLDTPDLDVVQYINKLFPTEQSLAGLDETMSDLNCQVVSIEDDMRDMVRSQTAVGGDAAAALEEAQTAIIQLFGQIRDIKNKAGESESMVKEITRDIKQLDTAKKNLTSAITTLNHLHMLVRGTATLTQLTHSRQYGEAALLLQGLLEVLSHFKNYQNIAQIKELSDQVESLKRELGDQIIKDFEAGLTGENSGAAGGSKQLAEACLVVSVLEPRVKRSLMSWFIQLQMKEYTILFTTGEDDAWLDKVDRRYNWLKKHLIEFEERFGPLFPPDWEMSERIAAEFCRVTRGDLGRLLKQRQAEVDTKLLLHAIQKTAAFESLLSRRFSGVTLNTSTQLETINNTRGEIGVSTNPFGEPVDEFSLTSNSYQAINLTPFKGIISQCFEPYLHIYLEAQDRNLAEMISRFAGDLSSQGAAPAPDLGEGSPVLASCGDLFVFYRKCLVQCSELSTGQPMLALATLFKKNLREYTSRVLVASLPKIGNSAGGSLQLPAMSQLSQLKDLSQLSQATTGILANFSSLLKEGEAVRFSAADQVVICSCLVTVEYCLDTTTQLEDKMKQKVETGLAEQISFSGELDMFHSVTGNCVGLLVQELDCACEQGLVSMGRVNWSAVEQVGDQSLYVSQLVQAMRGMVPRLRECLQTSRKYFTQFCIKFVSSFIPKFISNLYKCKPVGTVGAEQLLLDTHSLKTVLVDLPSLVEAGQVKPVGRKAPQAFTKVVVKGMTRAEMILKVVMSPLEPARAFVEQYVRLVQDTDGAELSKLLEMKGVKRSEQTLYLEMYRETQSAVAGGGAGAVPGGSIPGSPLHGGQQEQSRIAKLEKLIKNRL